MGILRVLRGHREALVVVGDELGQEGVGGFDVVDAAKPQLLHQPVLEGPVGPFHAAFGLWGVGVDGLDVEGLEHPGELGQVAFAIVLIDPEDAVLVRVEGHRAAVPVQIPAQGSHVGFGALGLGKT